MVQRACSETMDSGKKSTRTSSRPSTDTSMESPETAGPLVASNNSESEEKYNQRLSASLAGACS